MRKLQENTAVSPDSESLAISSVPTATATADCSGTTTLEPLVMTCGGACCSPNCGYEEACDSKTQQKLSAVHGIVLMSCGAFQGASGVYGKKKARKSDIFLAAWPFPGCTGLKATQYRCLNNSN